CFVSSIQAITSEHYSAAENLLTNLGACRKGGVESNTFMRTVFKPKYKKKIPRDPGIVFLENPVPPSISYYRK
ncbi:hypothetical protein KC717_02280, partial [Candidatus Dojkabacteria bacterium]|nr:hypothetical protein [Candidatus Dojkabacteria bacterium]